MTPAGPRRTLGEDVWIAVDDGAAVATARRRATALAELVGLDADRVLEVAIVTSELATNLLKHGGGGDLVLRAGDRGGVQLVAIDNGPGTRDLSALIDDGVSTVGTLGVGLGAVRRLSSHLDLWSEPARGAVVVADLASASASARPAVGHVVRTLRGETVCGDAVAYRETANGWALMVADGLGHGPLAAEASRRAVEVFESGRSVPPGELVNRMHRVLGGTRGAAVAVTEVDLQTRTLGHAAVGNISGRLLDADGRGRSLMTQPGIVGHKLPRVHELRHSIAETALVVLHSDGLTERWQPRDIPAVARHGATACAAVLLRDAGTRRDDASVLALQVTG